MIGTPNTLTLAKNEGLLWAVDVCNESISQYGHASISSHIFALLAKQTLQWPCGALACELCIVACHASQYGHASTTANSDWLAYLCKKGFSSAIWLLMRPLDETQFDTCCSIMTKPSFCFRSITPSTVIHYLSHSTMLLTQSLVLLLSLDIHKDPQIFSVKGCPLVNDKITTLQVWTSTDWNPFSFLAVWLLS